MSKKNRPTVNQHIVPQIYLKNFATKNSMSKYQIIVLSKRKKIKSRIDTINNVGYIKNFYTVDGETDEEKTAWETFYAKTVEPLYSYGVNNLIAKTILSAKDEVIDKDEKLILSKIIVAQWLRVPNFINKQVAKAECQLLRFKRKLIHDFIEIDQPKNVNLMKNWQPNSLMSKNFVLAIINDEDRLNKFASILTNKVWAIYYNPYYNTMPFITCDNPIITYNTQNKSFNLDINGLGRQETTFFFTLSPQIAVQVFSEVYSNYLNPIDGKRFFLTEKDVNFIFAINEAIYQNANREVYLPLNMRRVLNIVNSGTD